MAETLKAIDLDLIEFNPNNLRREHSDISELAASIEYMGLLEPPVVVKNGDTYMLVAGERRVRACHYLQQKKIWKQGVAIKCIVRSKMSEEEITAAILIENMQRVDLTPVEQANGVIALAVEHEFTEADIAQSLGVTKQWVKDRIAIHGLSPFIKDAIGNGLNLKSAVLLAGLPSDVRDRLTKDDKIPSQYDIEDRHNKELSSKKGLTHFRKLQKAGHLVATEKQLKAVIKADISSLSGDDFNIKSFIGGATGIKDNYWDKPDTPMVQLERIMTGSHDFTLGNLYVMRKSGGYTEWAKAKLYVPLSMASDKSEAQVEDEKYNEIEDANEAMEKEWWATKAAMNSKYVTTLAKPAELIAILLNEECETARPAYRARQCVAALETLGLSTVEDHEENWAKLVAYKNKNAANLARAAFAVQLDELVRHNQVPVEYPPEPTYLLHEDEEEYDASNDPFEETA